MHHLRVLVFLLLYYYCTFAAPIYTSIPTGTLRTDNVARFSGQNSADTYFGGADQTHTYYYIGQAFTNLYSIQQFSFYLNSDPHGDQNWNTTRVINAAVLEYNPTNLLVVSTTWTGSTTLGTQGGNSVTSLTDTNLHPDATTYYKVTINLPAPVALSPSKVYTLSMFFTPADPNDYYDVAGDFVVCCGVQSWDSNFPPSAQTTGLWEVIGTPTGEFIYEIFAGDCTALPCQHGGTCVGANQCTCIDGWVGNACQTAICFVHCVHGNCTQPNTCQCKSGWDGITTGCNTPICTVNCTHGICTGPDTCTCDNGWDGIHSGCETYVCANNGGCDYHVNCLVLGNGQRNCSACPNGTIGTGYTQCNTTCGDGRCSAEDGEDCLHCPQDCTMEDCGLCGDRVCDSPREDCLSCFKDCGPCDTTKSCNGGCSGHGQCLLGTGLCDCTQPWTGPTCSSQGQTVNVTMNSTNPIVTIEPIGGSPAKNSAKFSISIKSISEFMNEHTLVYSISLSEIEFSLEKEQNGENTKFNYSASLKNGAFISVVVWQLGQATSLEFAHVNTTYPADTIKIYVDIFTWPFRALANSLEIVLDSSSPSSGGKSTKNCVNSQEDESSSLQWLLVVVDDVSLYGHFESKAVIDGRIRTISYSLNQSDHSVSAILPHFWDSANLDPRFNVLLGDSKAKCGHSKTGSKLILEIVIPVVVALILVSVIILLLAPRIKLCFQLWKMERVPTTKQVEIEKINNMEVNSASGRYVVQL